MTQHDGPFGRRAEMAAERALVEAERDFWDRMARAGLEDEAYDQLADHARPPPGRHCRTG